MYISAVRLYHRAPWGWLYSYQAALITLRIMEISFILLRYLFFRAPLLVAWTRLPWLRNRYPYYKGLSNVLAPTKARASLTLGGGQLGTDLADIENVTEAETLMTGFMADVRPPSRFWSVFGCVVRGLFTDLGPAFIKFGQILSMREEIPPTVKKELQLLQDKLPPLGPKQVRAHLERELGKPVEAIFEWVEWEPIAAASLAQVHRAKLRAEQQEVALKIRRPYLEGIVALDTIIICDIFFGLLNRMLPLLHKSTDTSLLTSSYRESLEQEIDLVLEARNQQRFRKLVTNHPLYSQTDYVAEVYPQYCTTKLIVMELVNGYHRIDRLMDELTPQELLEFASTRVEGYSPELPLQIVFAQVSLCAESMCRWGFAHGDFHLGNLYALAPEEGNQQRSQWKIFICDFGMMMDFDESDRLITLQSLIDLTYYCGGSMLTHCFLEAPKDLPPTKKQRTKAIRHIETIFKKYMDEPEEGAERMMRFTIQPNSPKTILGDIVYGAATLGLKMDNTNYWLLLKNFSNVAVAALMLATNFNANSIIIGQSAKFIKDWTMAELKTLDIADLRSYYPEKLQILRRDDRQQVLKALATGEAIVPKKQLWTTPEKDVRFSRKDGAGPQGLFMGPPQLRGLAKPTDDTASIEQHHGEIPL